MRNACYSGGGLRRYRVAESAENILPGGLTAERHPLNSSSNSHSDYTVEASPYHVCSYMSSVNPRLLKGSKGSTVYPDTQTQPARTHKRTNSRSCSTLTTIFYYSLNFSICTFKKHLLRFLIMNDTLVKMSGSNPHNKKCHRIFLFRSVHSRLISFSPAVVNFDSTLSNTSH